MFCECRSPARYAWCAGKPITWAALPVHCRAGRALASRELNCSISRAGSECNGPKMRVLRGHPHAHSHIAGISADRWIKGVRSLEPIQNNHRSLEPIENKVTAVQFRAALRLRKYLDYGAALPPDKKPFNAGITSKVMFKSGGPLGVRRNERKADRTSRGPRLRSSCSTFSFFAAAAAALA